MMTTTDHAPIDPRAYDDRREWVQTAILMVEDGISIADVARALDIPYGRVYRRLIVGFDSHKARRITSPLCSVCDERLSYPSRTAQPTCRSCRKARGREQDATIIAMWQAGEGRAAIAAATGLPHQYISGRIVNIRKHQGIDLELRRHRTNGNQPATGK